MGRFKKPLELAQLDGSAKARPSRYGTVPKHKTPLERPTGRLSEDALVAWDEIVSRAIPGTLTHADALMVEVTANLLAEYWRDPEAMPMTKVNPMIQLFGRFGMSPADRSKLGVAKQDKKENPFLKTIE